MRYYIANFKANKNRSEIDEWIARFTAEYQPDAQKTIVICPPFPFLSLFADRCSKLDRVFVGAQTLSSKGQGSFTGEVPAQSIAGQVRFAIVGHSERRKHFGETDADLSLKVVQASTHHIEAIYCVRDENDPIPAGITFVAYEPVAAIGSGQNERLDDVLAMKRKLPLKPETVFIYGGSVNEKNVREYTVSEEINGFLMGGASLDPSRFLATVSA